MSESWQRSESIARRVFRTRRAAVGSNANVRPDNVIILGPSEVEDPRFVHTVRQDDLVELQYLSRQFSEARQKWEEKRDWIKAALRAGAGVELGLLAAELVSRRRPGYQAGDCEYEELVVR